MTAQEHRTFTSRREKAVPGFASTLPRARERGAKAYLRDGGANQPITQNRKSPAGLLHRNHKADTCEWKSDEKAKKRQAIIGGYAAVDR